MGEGWSCVLERERGGGRCGGGGLRGRGEMSSSESDWSDDGEEELEALSALGRAACKEAMAREVGEGVGYDGWVEGRAVRELPAGTREQKWFKELLLGRTETSKGNLYGGHLGDHACELLAEYFKYNEVLKTVM